MFKSCRVLLRVATILGTICGALILACVPAFFIIGFSSTIRDMLVEAIDNGTITAHSDAGLGTEEIVLVFQIMFIISGFALLIIGVLCVVNAIIASKARREPTRGRYIACIVTGALSTDFSLVAGILGLVCLSREEHRKKLEE